MKQEKINKIFSIFRKNYKGIPLEYFKKDPYKILISTLLSSRTKDEVTLEAAKRLFRKAPNIYQLSKLSTKEILKSIYPVGFYKVKSNNLYKLSKIICDEYNGIVPGKKENLIKLPGVGIKTANLVLNRAFGKAAIAVDVHVHRISNILGLVKTTNPEKTEAELMAILPKKYWGEVNRLFVSIGRSYRGQLKLIKFLKSNQLI
jgi:endonuclease III